MASNKRALGFMFIIIVMAALTFGEVSRAQFFDDQDGDGDCGAEPTDPFDQCDPVQFIGPPQTSFLIPSNIPDECPTGSIIRTDNLSVGEKVHIVGTPFDLVYFSFRVPGRQDDRKMTIPLTGANVSGVVEVRLDVFVGGNDFAQTFVPTPNLSTNFVWNGNSPGGQPLGARLATIKVTHFKSDGTTAVATFHRLLGHFEGLFQGIGGWMISVVHKYDNVHKRINFGNGQTRNVLTFSNSQGDILTTSEDGSEVYVFNANGFHIKTLNGLTGDLIYSFTNDSNNRLTSITDAFGNTTLINRIGSEPVSITAPFGQVTNLSVDVHGWLSSITNPNNETYSMTSSIGGLLLSFTQPNGHTSTMTYDGDGLLLKDLGAGGNFTTLSQNLSGNQTQVSMATALGRHSNLNITSTWTDSTQVITDPRGIVSTLTDAQLGTSQTIDPTGLHTQIHHVADKRYQFFAPLAGSTSATVPSTNLILTTTSSQVVSFANPLDPLSVLSLRTTTTLQSDPLRTSTFQYQTASKTVTQTSAEGRVQTLTYNNHGKIASTQFGDLEPTSFFYNPRGEPVLVTQGARINQLGYDSQGNLSSFTDSLGRATSFQYDAAGRVILKVNADGSAVSMGYDSIGQLISITPPGRPQHQFSTNIFDLVQNYLPPALGGNLLTPTTYSYNLDKQLTQINRPDGKVLIFNYDPVKGVLNSISAPDVSMQYTYSPQSGLLTSVQSIDNVVSNYTYLGPLPASQINSGSITGGVNFSYSPDFRLASISVQTLSGPSSMIALGYDNDNFLTIAGSERLSHSLTNGLITGTSLGVINEGRAFNLFGEIVTDTFKANNNPLYTVNFVRDSLGRIVTKTESTHKHSRTTGYSYDSVGRLTDVLADGKKLQHFTYDANGNRLTLSHSLKSGVEPAVYDAQDRLIENDDTRYGYNQNGELTSKRSDENLTQYRYDSLGNLKSVFIKNGENEERGEHEGRLRIDYLVDGQNRRVGKKVNGVLTQAFVYQSQLQVAAELDGSGHLVKRFVYGTKPNSPDYMITQGKTFRIISDHLGSPRFVVDTITGKVIQEMDYDAFGRITKDTRPGTTPFGFAGGIYDHDTRLVHFGAREYDPSTGRWLTRDPILFRGGQTNLFGYSFNDPINYVDPSGLAAGDEYPTQSGAAIAAINDINPTSVALGREFAGTIYKTPNGYSYTLPNMGTASTSNAGEACPSTTGIYHTHGSELPGYMNNEFSPTDVSVGLGNGLSSYLGTPSGVPRYFTPLTNQSLPLR